MSTLLTDILAVSTTFMSVLVITAGSPIVSVVYLIGVFVLAASYLVCMGLVYVGLTYLVVYVGAVAVLFLFVVMMFNVQHVSAYGLELTKGVPLGAILGSVFLLEAMSVIPSLTTTGTTLLQNMFQVINGLIIGVADVHPTASYVSLMFVEQAPDSSFTYLSQVQTLGLTLYAHGSLWLIVIGLILLLAMLGPITLCLRIKA
jgi:NADH-ubiquinone oxidoreductase chain 6